MYFHLHHDVDHGQHQNEETIWDKKCNWLILTDKHFAGSYNVTNNNTSGLQIEINPHGNYTLTVSEEGRPQTGKIIQADQLNQIPVGKTGHLKPCTDYSLNVSFTETLSLNDTGKEIFCRSTEKTFRTDPMSEFN